jgi:hypothetical protein
VRERERRRRARSSSSSTWPTGPSTCSSSTRRTDLREWLLDIEAVFKGVHAPPPERCRLLVGPATGSRCSPVELRRLCSFTGPTTRSRSSSVCRSAPSRCVVEVHGADVERYFRSLDSKAREIVALITAFVKELVAQRVKSRRRLEAASGGGLGDHGRRRRRRKSKKSSKSGSRSARRDSNADSRSRSGSVLGQRKCAIRRRRWRQESGELHPDWKPAGEFSLFSCHSHSQQPYQRHQMAKSTTLTC